MFVDVLISQALEVSFMLGSIEIFPHEILDVGLIDYPAGDNFLFLLLFDGYVGCIYLFFLEFAGLYFLHCLYRCLLLIAILGIVY